MIVCKLCKLKKESFNFYKSCYTTCKDCIKEKAIKWARENKDKRNKTKRLYRKKKLKDPLYKATKSLRHRVYMIFKNKSITKNNSTKKLLGEEFDVVKNHIESKFVKEMSWENHGKWHIDHIIPLSSAKTEEELIKLCHYTNLQPLWAEDNLRKSNNIT